MGHSCVRKLRATGTVQWISRDFTFPIFPIFPFHPFPTCSGAFGTDPRPKGTSERVCSWRHSESPPNKYKKYMAEGNSPIAHRQNNGHRPPLDIDVHY